MPYVVKYTNSNLIGVPIEHGGVGGRNLTLECVEDNCLPKAACDLGYIAGIDEPFDYDSVGWKDEFQSRFAAGGDYLHLSQVANEELTESMLLRIYKAAPKVSVLEDPQGNIYIVRNSKYVDNDDFVAFAYAILDNEIPLGLNISPYHSNSRIESEKDWNDLVSCLFHPVYYKHVHFSGELE